MKWLFAIIVVIVTFFAFRTYMDHARAEADRVAFEKLDRERAERAAQQRVKDDEERKKLMAKREADEALARRQSMGVTKIIDPLVINVTASLDPQRPFDYVPQLELTKQRVLDKKPRAEAERKGVYDRAAEVFDALSGLAEERTKLLEEMLRNKAKTNALDQPGRANTTADFFNRSVSKRWEEQLARYRPALNQRLELLRAAERAWNAQVGELASEETYELPAADAALVTVDSATVPGGPLDATSGTNGQVSRPWRRSYYDQNGYRYPNFSR